MTYRNLDEVRRANQAIGHHFFDVDTLRFFKSRIHDTLHGGRYFVTSERNSGYTSYGAYDHGRHYTIREAMSDGSIETVGEFDQYKTSKAAHRAAQRLVKDRTLNFPGFPFVRAIGPDIVEQR